MNYSINKQRGAVLVICLVVLAVITLIAVSELSKAGDQSRMATNSQQYNQTFQGAESAMDHAMKMISEQTTANETNMAALGSAINVEDGSEIVVPNTALSHNNMTVSVAYKTETVNVLRAGISLDSSQNDSMIRKVNFTATSTAVIENSGAVSTIVQGFTYE